MPAIEVTEVTMAYGDEWTAALVPMGILAAYAVVVTLLAARLSRWEST